MNRAFRMNRRRLGILKVAVILAVFGFAIHITHRDCAQSADIAFRSGIESAAASSGENDLVKPLKPEEFQATAYCVTGLTASGVPVAPGHVSADPKVIPLGSMIYVETPLMSGVYQVMDTGELIKGKIIDIFIPSYDACVDFGRRIVKVKVLRYGFNGDPQEKKSSKSVT